MIEILTGDNAYERKRYIQKTLEDFVTKHGDLSVERFDGEEASGQVVLDAANSVPFLATAKLVFVQNAAQKELFEMLLDNEVAESTSLILDAPKLDKRASYYKKISKLPGYKNFEVDKKRSPVSWIVETAKEQGGTITASDARFLVERIGTNQMLLASEIGKLVTYSPHITKKTIELLCEPTPQTTIFQLIDSAFAGNLARAQYMYLEQRQQKVEPQAIMGMIAWQLHVLAVAKLNEGKSPDGIAKEASLSPFVVRKGAGIARKLSVARLKALVQSAHDIDLKMKRSSVDADEAILGFIAQLSCI